MTQQNDHVALAFCLISLCLLQSLVNRVANHQQCPEYQAFDHQDFINIVKE